METNYERAMDDPQYTVGSLLALYGCEQYSDSIKLGNKYPPGMYLDRADASILGDIAKSYLRRGYVTDNQLSYVRRKLQKYRKTLDLLPVSPFPTAKKEISDIEKIADVEGNNIILHFPYDPQMVKMVQILPGKKWDVNRRCFKVPINPKNIGRIKALGFPFSKDLSDLLLSLEQKPDDSELIIPGLKKTLRPFQIEGVREIRKRGGRCILGDDMGLGKTIQTLAWFLMNPTKRPGIILCPASLKYNWVKEIIEGTNIRDIQVISGAFSNFNASQLDRNAELFIINFDILDRKEKSWIPWLLSLKPKALFIDEAHFVKNRKARRTRACLEIAKQIPHIIPITGTAVEQKPTEIFYLSKMVDKSLFPSFSLFKQRYEGASSEKLKELNNILKSTILIRRKKDDVLKDLPPKQRIIIPMSIQNRRMYDEAEDDLIGWLAKVDPERMEKAQRAEALVKISYLKKLAVQGKLNEALGWIEDFLENKNKIVVFSWHKETLDAIDNRFKGKTVRLDGSIAQEKRPLLVEAFQNDPNISIFNGNIKSAGVGLTLTAADTSYTLEYMWTPGTHDQAEDRVHRIGQSSDRVFAYYPMAQNTIEEKIAELLDKKRKIKSAILDGEDVEDGELLMELLKEYKKGKFRISS